MRVIGWSPVVVSDNIFAHKRSFSLLVTVASLALMVPFPAWAADLPTGGQIVAGSGSIATAGNTMTVQQNTASMEANWQSFSIGQGHSVNFVQPSSTSVALNRVLGSDVSVIQGAITANGQTFLINPNGVLFTPTAQVNTGGLVASTLNLKTADFLSGKYSFEGSSNAAITNQGNIIAGEGGTVALIAATIVNEGQITTPKGSTLLGAGRSVTLDLGGPVKLEVTEGALNTLIEQNGAIRADGGRVYLTAKAAADLATSVINHAGVTEAQTLVTGEKGEIILIGDMAVGTTNVAGTLDASAPHGGDGGFIETSAAYLNLAEDTKITAGSAYGLGGEWLIDPFDYVIDATAAGNIVSSLNTGTNVTVSTTANVPNLGGTGAGTNGNIKVASAIAKTAGGDATLTMRAANVIEISAPISSTAGKLNLLLDADNDNGTRDGGGITIVNNNISLNGGDMNFGTGAAMSLGGVTTLVGGDVYIGGDGAAVKLQTGGGTFNLYGQLLIANRDGVEITTSNGNANFYDIINSGNQYEKVVVAPYTWTQAFNAAKNGTAGGAAVGDQYLATVTSRLENSVVVYTGGFLNGATLQQGAWLAGQRVEGIGTDTIWRWVAGPEAAMDGGKGAPFADGASGSVSIDDSFMNWQSGEPNGGIGGENYLQIGDAQGRWNDLRDNDILLGIYIRETNFGKAKLTVDAGTGTTYFAKPIGGLGGIDFTAYNASNLRPVTSTPSSIPQNSAITTAQASAGASMSGTTPSAAFINSPQYSPAQPNTGPSGGAPSTIGTLDIVQVSSNEIKSGDGNSKDSADGSAQSQFGGSGNVDGFMKVFVVDGGVNLSHEQSEDRKNKNHSGE